MKIKTALTIAGSDSSGGAGIQADIKAMTLNGIYAMSAITAITAQNTLGVTSIQEVTAEILQAQIDAVFTDIRPDAVKIGMIPNAIQVEIIADCLKKHHAENIVLDPVMVATSGAALSCTESVQKLKELLMPLAMLITPNIPEAEVLSGMKITDAESMENAAASLHRQYGCAVLLKGGHCVNDSNDCFYGDDGIAWFREKRVKTKNTHGTGCTLSSAIAANIAKGMELKPAIARAKEYLTGALAAGLDLGVGSGPLYHGWDICGRFREL